MSLCGGLQILQISGHDIREMAEPQQHTLATGVLPTKAVTTIMNLDEKAPSSEVAAELQHV
eukprot:4193342-Prorocentrum_lima.AAC.1